MSLHITPKQKEVLAEIMAANINAYGWRGAESTHGNCYPVGSITDVRKLKPYEALANKGLLTLLDSETDTVGCAHSPEFVRLTPEAYALAESAFDTFYSDSFQNTLARAEARRNLSD
jgi:hypothetical protein